jgi:thiamine biosynthesis lipoprotein
MQMLPPLLLAVAFFCAIAVPKTILNQMEPFDFWILGKAAIIPGILAVLGLAASFFIPMAYCRYGCPTGALLSFMRTASSREGFGRRDFFALLVLMLGAWLTIRNPDARPVPNGADEIRGTGFGTTWCVKTRGTKIDHVKLRTDLAAEIERVENTLSHWRSASETNRFNATKTLDPMPVSNELILLVEFASRIGQASNGAYDITVAPLVNEWGYGPLGAISHPPSPERIKELLPAVGWRNLEVDGEQCTLRKKHPSVALDLGSILQGYAADRLGLILKAAGVREALIEVGGELLAIGTWVVAIENPADAAKPLEVLELKDAALATSGLARARRKFEGKKVSHIISPITGMPVESGIELVSVRAPTCLEADGWATALIASDLSQAEAIAAKEAMGTWILTASGEWKVKP